MKNEKNHMSGSKLTGAEISAYFRKNPKAKAVKKAVEIALDHGGAMNYAVKEIEKLKRGLSKHPEVKKALDHANFESVQSESIQTVNRIISENYTKNFESLCASLKLNGIQQKILNDFINKGRIRDQYVGRVAGTKKEKRIYAGKTKYTGSIENRTEALMKALKVNAKQKGILDSYLKTGKVVGKYTGSIAGSTKPTKSYAGFRGFKEHFESINEIRSGMSSQDIKNQDKLKDKHQKTLNKLDKNRVKLNQVPQELVKYAVSFMKKAGTYGKNKNMSADDQALEFIKLNLWRNESVDEGYASNDPKVKAIGKKFKKLINDIRRGYMDVTDRGAKKLYAAVHGYLMNNERGDWDDVDFADEKISDFIHDMSKFGLGKV